MTTPFLGQVMLFAGNFAPRGWALCNGQLLPIQANAALFSLLGTAFGGNGTSNFGLPNLQGAATMGQGTGPSLPATVMGQFAGTETETILTTSMPSHNHILNATTVTATTSAPSGQILAAGSQVPSGKGGGSPVALNLYTAPGSTVTLAPQSVSAVGGNQPHNNMQPYLALSWCIALEGVYPSRN